VTDIKADNKNYRQLALPSVTAGSLLYASLLSIHLLISVFTCSYAFMDYSFMLISCSILVKELNYFIKYTT